MALAHAIENKVEAAYRRGDLFVKRRKMMQEWADYLDRIKPDDEIDTKTRTSEHSNTTVLR